ncbi:MAG: glycosyltransferase family 4 protein [Thermodesulfobacteriota bacterium]|nr:glycosyltransferase family 4 protein [Thermodesulfobacteriota bacterium]
MAKTIKAIHLFSNWKWTGPAEPALYSAISLKKEGHEIYFACGNGAGKQGLSHFFYEEAQRRGLSLFNDMILNKHISFKKNFKDILTLKNFLKERDIDIIHCHLTNDNIIGGIAAKIVNKKIKLVRSIYDQNFPVNGLRNRLLALYITDGFITYTQKTFNNINSFRKSPQFTWKLDGAVNTERFNPDKKLNAPDKRQEFGIRQNDFLVGIVARVQPQRRFDIFLEGIKRAYNNLPSLRVFIIGEGSKINQVAVNPIKKMGLEKVFRFTKIQRGDHYLALLKALDVKVLIRPGSDETCRAVREAMAMGVPVIASNFGILPETVDNKINGIIINDSPEKLAEAILFLAKNREIKEKLGINANKKAREKFSLEKHGKKLGEIYRQVLNPVI